MKRSTITLSIISAILLSACGSSSNSDNNQPVDPTPTPNPAPAPKPAPSPTAPTTPTSAASNPAPEVVNPSSPSSPSSSNSNNNPISPPSIPSISGKPHQYPSITLKKDEEAKKKSEEEEAKKKAEEVAKNTIKIPDPIDLDKLTKEEAEKLVKDAAKKHQDTEIAVNNAENELNALNGKGMKISSSYQLAIKKVINSAKDKGKLAIAEQNLKNIQDTYDKSLAEYINKSVEVVKLKAKLEMANKELILAKNASEFADKKAIEPQAVLDRIKIDNDYFQARTQLQFFTQKQAILMAEKKAIEENKKELKSMNKALNEAKEKVPSETKKTIEDIIKKNEEEIAKLNKKAEEKTAESEKLNISIGQSDIVVKDLKPKSINAHRESAHRGVYGDGAYAESSFQAIDKIIKSGGDNWTLTLKGVEKPLVISTNTSNSIKFEGSTEYGRFKKVDDKVMAFNTFDNSIYGYTDAGKFFSAGQVAPDDVKNISGANFKGYAFLTTKADDKKINLVSNVEALVDLHSKSLTGKFESFKSYKNGEKSVEDYNELGTNPYDFTSEIKGNKFVPAKGYDKQAQAYGYFYGTDASEIGGLVKHEKFEGAFGATKKTNL